MQYGLDLDKLNEYQREAVLDESNACVVNANVGSGKTTVLTAKILYLHLIKGIRLRDMIVLTFTNKAAGEIRERLTEGVESLNEEDLAGFGTFHSVALKLLRDRLPVERLSFTRDFQVIDPAEEQDMALQLIREKGLKIKYKNRLRQRLDQVMPLAAGKKDEAYRMKKASKYQDDFPVLTDLLLNEKIRQNLMTFSDLLIYAAELMDRWEGSRPSWIIIDEVQDSDSLQLELTDRLKGAQTKLFAVGDPNQVIYSFRGTQVNVFYTLKSRYGARELSLPVNYRSCESILNAARIFQQNGTVLAGSRTGGGTISLKRQYDPFTEACYLAERIRQLHENGLAYEEIAVFYRLLSQSAVLEDVFGREGIPCEVSAKKTAQDLTAEPPACQTADTVKLMTLHSSKGLEFTQVFIIGVNNGLIPLQSGADEEEEERRLFFVGMTRARDALELSYYINPGYPKVTSGEGRFLKMIPERFLTREENREGIASLQELKKEILRARQTDEMKQLEHLEQEAAFMPGQDPCRSETSPPIHRVRHAKYGTGVVVKEDETMLCAEFEGYGEKEFLKAFMELEYLP